MSELTRSSSNYVFAALSILSIPSAYAAGFIFAIGHGVSSILDAGFFAQELTRLMFTFAGFSLAARFLILLASDIAKDGQSLRKETPKKIDWISFTYFALALLFILPIFCILIWVFLDIRLAASLTFTSIWSFMLAIFCHSRLLLGENTAQGPSILSHIKKSFYSKSYFIEPKLAIVNVFAVLLLSGNFGYHRAIALAISKPVCIAIGNEKTYGAIVGQTSLGFVIAEVEHDDLITFTFPIGSAILKDSVFSFVSSQQDFRISATCS